MPEQITKYPDVTMKVLESAGARCGEGLEQQILTECPPESFCSLPGGEACIYGIDQIPQMTQISEAELAEVVCHTEASADGLSISPFDGLVMAGALVLGVALGGVWKGWKG